MSGAAAALAGLLFVALSINLTRIISLPGVPDRAGQTLIFLGGVLVSAFLGLVPQSARDLGLELLCVGCTVWSVAAYYDVRALRRRDYDTLSHGVQRLVSAQIATLPLVIASASLVSRRGGGLYWLVPSLILPLVVSMFNAWILLVEILR